MDFSLLETNDNFDFIQYFQPIIDEFAAIGRHVEIKKKDKLEPRSFMTRCFTLPDLYAGKMHALVYRAWKNRVKGRDWYDFEWNVRHKVPLDFNYLQERIKEFNGCEKSKEQFLDDLKNRLASADINQVKADVLPFIKNPRELEIWSNDYFLQLASLVRFE